MTGAKPALNSVDVIDILMDVGAVRLIRACPESDRPRGCIADFMPIASINSVPKESSGSMRGVWLLRPSPYFPAPRRVKTAPPRSKEQ